MSKTGYDPQVLQLLEEAKRSGTLSNAGFSALAAASGGGTVIIEMDKGLGGSAKNTVAKRVMLLVIVLDDSGSIAAAGNEQSIRDGCNSIIEAVTESKEGGEVLVFIILFNSTVPLNSFVPINSASRLDDKNYKARGGTPLYDKVAASLALTVAKSQEFVDFGITDVQALMIVLTDGHDEYSQIYRTPESVAPAVREACANETPGLIVIGWGIDDGYTDFRDIFTRMGISPEWILTSGADAHSIREAARLTSKTAGALSKSGASFSQAARSKTGLGGFKTT